MCVCVYMCIYIYICVCVCVCVCMYMCTYKYIYNYAPYCTHTVIHASYCFVPIRNSLPGSSFVPDTLDALHFKIHYITFNRFLSGCKLIFATELLIRIGL